MTANGVIVLKKVCCRARAVNFQQQRFEPHAFLESLLRLRPPSDTNGTHENAMRVFNTMGVVVVSLRGSRADDC